MLKKHQKAAKKGLFYKNKKFFEENDPENDEKNTTKKGVKN